MAKSRHFWEDLHNESGQTSITWKCLHLYQRICVNGGFNTAKTKKVKEKLRNCVMQDSCFNDGVAELKSI